MYLKIGFIQLLIFDKTVIRVKDTKAIVFRSGKTIIKVKNFSRSEALNFLTQVKHLISYSCVKFFDKI